MSPNDYYSLTRARPFVPFRVVTSDGTVYEVRHPDMLLVTAPSVVVGYPNPQAPDQALRFDIVANDHVIRLETIREEALQGPPGNGQGHPTNP
jgi:hypothetical protein